MRITQSCHSRRGFRSMVVNCYFVLFFPFFTPRKRDGSKSVIVLVGWRLYLKSAGPADQEYRPLYKFVSFGRIRHHQLPFFFRGGVEWRVCHQEKPNKNQEKRLKKGGLDKERLAFPKTMALMKGMKPGPWVARG